MVNWRLLDLKDWGKFLLMNLKTLLAQTLNWTLFFFESDSIVQELLSFYMGKNTQERQHFIIDNLRVEKNLIDSLENER